MRDLTVLHDNELQRLAANGDRAAEEALAGRYMQLVRVCARPLFLAGGDSEDLSQEGMFGLLSAIREYDPAQGVSFRSFAEHCIRMRLFSAVKSASRLKHLPLNDSMPLEQLSDDPSSQLSAAPEIFRRSPEDLVLARESKEELKELCERRLSRLEKQVLDLYLEGLSYRDIARRLQREDKSVDNAVQRIRRKLAQTLHPGDISES
ncbi:MAG: sigma-70 family RNA polymerase sigma factor [Oscillospiraceae bacterium]|jgi:RNA polymerase sporulation-specific sigma factor|nr:sigma-70 family RNA polymerase sigma factor [Oscillospiraceae bacterium]